MNISIIGAGYVGLVTGACFSELGVNVLCMDKDENKVINLKKGIVPIYEQGLKDIVENSLFVSNKLNFTTSIKEAVDNSDVIFIAVNTPTLDNNSPDLKNVLDVVQNIACHMDCYKVIVTKSTVPVGTGRYIKEVISDTLLHKGRNIDFDVVSNPEFLREGCAVKDFMNPERIVIGAESQKSVNIMKDIYKPQISLSIPFIVTNIETAEMIKYASNAFLATKISFINEMANLCELCGADVNIVSKGMGMDRRIGPSFLNPGPGYGGSCFPKDTKALLGIGKTFGYTPKIVRSVIEVNEHQKKRMFKKICKAVGKVSNKVISILGVAYKPGTDDIRESPSIYIIKSLLKKNAMIKVFDPKAMDNMEKLYPDINVKYCSNAYSACENSDCIVLLTEWNEFNQLDFSKLKSIVKKPILIDLRNVYEPDYIKEFGFLYIGVGR